MKVSLFKFYILLNCIVSYIYFLFFPSQLTVHYFFFLKIDNREQFQAFRNLFNRTKEIDIHPLKYEHKH